MQIKQNQMPAPSTAMTITQFNILVSGIITVVATVCIAIQPLVMFGVIPLLYAMHLIWGENTRAAEAENTKREIAASHFIYMKYRTGVAGYLAQEERQLQFKKQEGAANETPEMTNNDESKKGDNQTPEVSTEEASKMPECDDDNRSAANTPPLAQV